MPESKLIPIYDDTAPIACTISNAEIPERVALVQRMRASMTAVDRTETGLLLHFPNDDVIRGDLEAFAIDERLCCQFWGFAIVDQTNGIALRWDGPPAVDDLLDRLHTFFISDEPVDFLDGLL